MSGFASSPRPTRYLAGDHFIIADLFMTAYLSFYMQFGMLERLPAFEAFCAHHLNRPAGLAAKARDEALIAAKKTGVSLRLRSAIPATFN